MQLNALDGAILEIQHIRGSAKNAKTIKPRAELETAHDG